MSHAAPGAPADTRWVGTGRSTATDAAQAGKEATAQAVAGDDTELLVVYASMAHDTAALLRGVRSIAPDAAIVGLRSGIDLGAADPGPPRVVVAALGGSGFHAVPAVSRGVGGRLRDAGAEVARAVTTLPDELPHRALLLLVDGSAGDQQDIVRGAYRVVGGAVPLVGGCSGDALARETQQIYGDEVLSDALVAVALASEAPIGVGVGHGWRRVGEPALVTRSAANRVLELDGAPALDVYLQRLGLGEDLFGDPVASVDVMLTHPLGVLTRHGEEVRVVGAADPVERSLTTMATIHEGGMACFMRGDRASVLDGTRDAMAGALGMLDGCPPVGLLAFDCVGRRRVLDDDSSDSDRLMEELGGAPVATVPTHGEIARVRGTTGFHNQTLVVLAFG